jgi:hypothetical protein
MRECPSCDVLPLSPFFHARRLHALAGGWRRSGSVTPLLLLVVDIGVLNFGERSSTFVCDDGDEIRTASYLGSSCGYPCRWRASLLPCCECELLTLSPVCTRVFVHCVCACVRVHKPHLHNPYLELTLAYHVLLH